jgi:hypothetical protein
LLVGVVPASADSSVIDAKDREHLLALAGRHLLDRADRLVHDFNTTELTAVPVSAPLKQKLAADRDAIDERRALLRHANGGHSKAEVRFTEHTKLYFAVPPAGGPRFEEYGLGRTLTFALSSGEWRLAEAATGIRPGALAPDTEPNAPGAVKSSAPKIGTVAGTAVVAKPGLGGSDVSAAYDYVAMLNYANRYWGPTNNHYNQAYRTYGGCRRRLHQLHLPDHGSRWVDASRILAG